MRLSGEVEALEELRVERVGEKAVRMEERRGVKEEKRLVRVECILVVGGWIIDAWLVWPVGIDGVKVEVL